MQERIFIRHVESEANADSRHNSNDTPLTPRGIKDAAIIGQKLIRHNIDRIFVSPYDRSLRTGIHIALARYPDQPWSITSDPRLREIRKPSSIIGQQHNNPEVIRIKKALLAHSHRPEWRHLDEESPYELLERVTKFLTDTETTGSLSITHSGVMRMILAMTRSISKTPEEIVKLFLSMRSTIDIAHGAILIIDGNAPSLHEIKFEKLL